MIMMMLSLSHQTVPSFWKTPVPSLPPCSDVHHDLTDYNPQTREEPSSELSNSSGASDSAPEVWDDESSFSENKLDPEDPNKLTAAKQLHYTVCLLLSFFQLCFRLSARALIFLLLFLSALFKHFCSFIQNDYFTAFAKMFPTTLYSLRRQLKLKSHYTTYVVCPRCHSLYKEQGALTEDQVE